MSNRYIGSEFNDFLEDEGIKNEVEAEAIKKVIAWQVQSYINEHAINKTVFAKLMQTSRSQLDRLLDPDNTSVSLNTLVTAANVMGKKLEIKLHD
jgi:predicted XRE-type DNA-binding protein